MEITSVTQSTSAKLVATVMLLHISTGGDISMVVMVMVMVMVMVVVMVMAMKMVMVMVM